MDLYNYFFTTQEEKDHKKKYSTKYEFIPEPKPYATLYLVVDKSTRTPLGIFDSLELAKSSGDKITYYNCEVIPFNVNGKCKYMYNTVYESN